MLEEDRVCRHVMIYGPPGAGKLTVAQRLAERYGMRLLDNHVSVDAALRLFSFGTPEFGELVERIRVALLQAAAAADLDVVTTLVYAHLVDDDHVEQLIAASESGGARVTLVQLSPSTDELERRVRAASRAGTQKVTDPVFLRRLLTEYDLRTPARVGDFSIDNTSLSADAVADLIARHVGLTGPRSTHGTGDPALDRSR